MIIFALVISIMASVSMSLVRMDEKPLPAPKLGKVVVEKINGK